MTVDAIRNSFFAIIIKYSGSKIDKSTEKPLNVYCAFFVSEASGSAFLALAVSGNDELLDMSCCKILSRLNSSDSKITSFLDAIVTLIR